jgi:hypothetical protein
MMTGDYFNLYTKVLSYKTWGEKRSLFILHLHALYLVMNLVSWPSFFKYYQNPR